MCDAEISEAYLYIFLSFVSCGGQQHADSNVDDVTNLLAKSITPPPPPKKNSSPPSRPLHKESE
jgi:hypothetical protein